MTLSMLIVLASAAWLLSCGASVLALYWNMTAGSLRLRAAFISSCIALLVGYWGMGRIQLSASKTVNGQVEWSINSRWFFLGALALGAASLASTLWNWRKARRRPAGGSLPGEACGHFGDEPSAPPKGGLVVPAGISGGTEGPPSVS